MDADERTVLFGCATVILIIAGHIAVIAAVVWVAVHFISKWW